MTKVSTITLGNCRQAVARFESARSHILEAFDALGDLELGALPGHRLRFRELRQRLADLMENLACFHADLIMAADALAELAALQEEQQASYGAPSHDAA